MKAVFISGLLCCLSLPVQAEGVDVHGFFTTRYSQTDEAAYYLAARDEAGINEDGSFLGTRLGLNLSAKILDGIDVWSQLVAEVGGDGYVARVDWAFLSMQMDEGLTLRAGKIKFPVGLVNEYVGVGLAYPWIDPPEVIYAEHRFGSNATRDAYSGASLLWKGHTDSWDWGMDLFTGQVDLTGMTVKGLGGLTLRLGREDILMVQGSYYKGEMYPKDPNAPMAAEMEGRLHSVTMIGFKLDWRNMIAYAERSHVHMANMAGEMDSNIWYLTLGYQAGRWLPHLTQQQWQQRSGYGQGVIGLGLNYMLSEDVVVKLGLNRIESERITPLSDWQLLSPPVTSVGLFDRSLSDDVTTLVSVAIETVF